MNTIIIRYKSRHSTSIWYIYIYMCYYKNLGSIRGHMIVEFIKHLGYFQNRVFRLECTDSTAAHKCRSIAMIVYQSYNINDRNNYIALLSCPEKSSENGEN